MTFYDCFSDLKGLGIDDKFIANLFESYQRFSEQIMIDITTFSYEPKKTGFADLNLMSREYAVQKYFEKRLETYVRNYLVTSFFEKILEERGYDVYVPSCNIPDDQYASGEVFLTNEEFEDNAGFEFVIDTGEELIGCRFTDIQTQQAEKWFATEMINSIIIIDWYNTCLSSTESEKRNDISGRICVMGIWAFVAEWLGDAERTAYELFLRKVIEEYRETIGISSLPKLTAPVLFNHRLDVERVELLPFIKDIRYFAKIEKADVLLPEEQRRDTHFGYRIIDSDSYKTEKELKYSQDIELRSKQLLSDSEIIDIYSSRKLYKALVGKKDFAKSFLTAEYLYSQYDENDCFDYTSIVSGYLKSIEQLLATIVFSFADQPVCSEDPSKLFRVKSNCKRKRDGGFPESSKREGKIFKLDLTKAELDFVDTTIGSLIHFLKEYSNQIMLVSSEYQQTIIDCLECYRIDCRNASFHTHNNYDWNRVEIIRHNTLVLYILLLGGIRLDENESVVFEHFGIVKDDRLERIYYWLRKLQLYTFRIKFKDDIAYLVSRKAESSFPAFDNNGLLLDDFSIDLRCLDGDSDREPEKRLTIDRNNIPEMIWNTTISGYYPLDFEA